MSKIRLIPYAAMTAAGLLAASGAANAQSMRDINQQQDSQQDRIERGIYSGQISRSEANRLEQGERAIDSAQRRAAADGHVTGQERARLDRMTDLQGREINQQSHDRQQAGDHGQGWGRTDGRPNNGWSDRNGSGHQDADRRDWGRGHNDGSWNNGRNNNGWDRNGGNNASNGWNRGNGGSNQNGNGTGAGTGTTAGSGHTWGANNGGGHRGGAGTITPRTPATGGAAVASNTGNRSWGNWGGQTRQVSAMQTASAPTRQASAMQTASAPTRNYATANTGARSGGGRSFGGGGGRR